MVWYVEGGDTQLPARLPHLAAFKVVCDAGGALQLCHGTLRATIMGAGKHRSMTCAENQTVAYAFFKCMHNMHVFCWWQRMDSELDNFWCGWTVERLQA